MSEVQRLLDEQAMRDAEKRVEDETYEAYKARKKQEEKDAAVAREIEFRQDLIRELRVMNRLKAIEILENSPSIASLGQDYAFLINVSSQWVGNEYDTIPQAPKP